jgi:hypothetical protein
MLIFKHVLIVHLVCVYVCLRSQSLFANTLNFHSLSKSFSLGSSILLSLTSSLFFHSMMMNRARRGVSERERIKKKSFFGSAGFPYHAHVVFERTKEILQILRYLYLKSSFY